MDVLTFVLGALAVWRVTHLIHAEDGPWGAFSRWRQGLGAGMLADLVNCFYCLSLWVALPFAVVEIQLTRATWLEFALIWPALSAGAIAIHQAMGRASHTEDAAAIYFEDSEEKSDHVLRDATKEFH